MENFRQIKVATMIESYEASKFEKWVKFCVLKGSFGKSGHIFYLQLNIIAQVLSLI